MNKILKNIPGFRSGKKNKMTIATIYYILALLMFSQGFGQGLFALVAPSFVFLFLDIIKHRRKTKHINKIILKFVISLALIIVSVVVTPDIEKADTSQKEHQQEEKDSSIADQTDIFQGYKIIEVAGGDTSGYREANVAVNIGFGNRDYWGFTNEHGQLIKVLADEIVLQDDYKEDVNSDGRYYSRMANVPGVGADTGYDRGHVIADSLGGVANAYNITPQNATLNRHGDQAYMEKVIRDAGGCSDFEAIITYPDTQTQIPSHYKFTYTLKGNVIVDEFANVDPDKYNKSIGLYDDADTKSNQSNKVEERKTEVETKTEVKYILNTNSKKIHYADCSSVKRIREINKQESYTNREELISQGYDPCGSCKP